MTMMMADYQPQPQPSLRRKARSASICAPGSQSMEQMLCASSTGPNSSPAAGGPGLPPSAAAATNGHNYNHGYGSRRFQQQQQQQGRGAGEATPDGTTPTRRPRRPATRSQSARVTGANKSVRRKAAQQQAAAQQNEYSEGSTGVRSVHCISEPRLTENEPSPGLRRRGSRRGQSVQQRNQRRINYLDVPEQRRDQQQQQQQQGGDQSLDEDLYRLRSFSLTSKGVINRGDSFRKKRSRSNSLAPTEPGAPEAAGQKQHQEQSRAAVPREPASSYTVAVLGCSGVGKSALISQFMSSEETNAYDHVRQRDTPSEQSVFVMLNGEESELKFIDITNIKELEKVPLAPQAFVVMYSVIDKASFQRAEETLSRLHEEQDLKGRAVILVGNKIDLVRSRVVSAQDGKCLACTYRAKFAEISVGINHNIDNLLVGILSQIRLKVSQRAEQCRGATVGPASSAAGPGNGDSEHWYKSRGVVRASMKARQMFTWLFGREDRKFKNCENLHVL